MVWVNAALLFSILTVLNTGEDFCFLQIFTAMNFESLVPFLLFVAPFVVAFFLEALILCFFKLQTFWIGVGLSFLVNVLSLGMLSFGVRLLSSLGYAFDGMLFPVQAILALWWLSVVVDGLLLQLFIKKKKEAVYVASLVMNTVSYGFLYFMIANTH